jgi:hypothetical protein
MAKASNHNRQVRAIIIACIVFIILLTVPLLLISFYHNTDTELTSEALSKQQTVASITASALKLKIDRLVGIAEAMASSSELVTFAANDQWKDAANVTRDLQNETRFYDTYIDRVALFDESGVEQSAYPTLSSGIGSGATSSAWYHAINNGAAFYISDVTQRTAVPRLNVMNIAVPIMNHGAITGILILQVPTTAFLEFAESASLGTYGFIYLLDGAGNIISHPKFPSNNGVVNLSSNPLIWKILAEKQGYLSFSDENYTEGFFTYQQVAGYNWEVVTQEPYSEMFATRNSILQVIAWEVIAASLIDLFISYMLFFFLMPKDQTRKKS